MQPEVVVVGAGPTGLLLAGDLARAGVATVVLEQRAGRSHLTRAFAVHARTLETLDMRGLADALVERGTTVPKLNLFGNAAVDLSRLPSRFPFLLVVPQYVTEELLEDRARAAGADVQWSRKCLGIETGVDGAPTVVWQDEHGRTGKLSPTYVVGADGVHSSVRDAVGLPFPGQSVVSSVMLADVRLHRPPEEPLTVDAGEAGFAFLVPFGDGWHRVIAWDRDEQHDDSEPVSLEQVRATVEAVLGTDYGMHDARWLSRFHCDERQVPRYRAGEIFLAGDAAHVHSPAGGQGMNAGLQDAANLSWKLAMVLNGQADPELLQTYSAERHPVGQHVINVSHALLRAAMAHHPVTRGLRDVAASVVGSTPWLSRRAALDVSALDVAYADGPHDVGKRAEDLPLLAPSSGMPTRIYEAARDGAFVLATSTTTRTQGPVGLPDHVLCHRLLSPSAPPMLVRPDGYLAWTGAPGGDDAVGAGVAQALEDLHIH